MATYTQKNSQDNSAVRVLRRFSSIKVDFEKEKRKTLSRYQQQGLRVSVPAPKFSHDKKEIKKRLRVSVERYSMPELYVKMICALFPAVNSRENPDSNALIQHLMRVFRLNDLEHNQLMEIARTTKLPQRIINLEIVEAKDVPAKDTNGNTSHTVHFSYTPIPDEGLSDPFCVVFVNSRDVAQRTKVVYNTLDPVWKQYFTFKVNDPTRDVLCLEVMDYNEEDEPLRNRFRKFREIKSPSTLGTLLKEIANARSVQELIGTVRIPVTDISSETIEKWFKLKNHEDRGEIYLRMALGYNKSKEAATEEFLQIIHFLLVHELDRKDSALGTPFYWDEHYEMWSKYILRQFKWQGGLKPKDIVLAKWRAYTIVNDIFPLNANMMCLLMDALLERVANCEYDTREISRFWTCTELLLNTIMMFLQELHEVLRCPVTVLHTYHMLRTIDMLNQFLRKPRLAAYGSIPFNDTIITDRVVKAVRDGANKFYVKVFSEAPFESIPHGQDPLFVALERLLKMGQILHEDLNQGVTTIHTDFKGYTNMCYHQLLTRTNGNRILGIDYQRITFQVYDEQFGKMVKYIVEEYSSKLLDPIDQEGEMDGYMDEDSPAVKSGLAVLKLYYAVKNLADLAPPNYVEDVLSEFSLKRSYHEWFFHSVATWIDILRNKMIKWVKNSIFIEGKNLGSESTDTKLSKIDQQETTEVPISTSALDTAAMFVDIHKFWLNLGWEDPQQSYVIVRKLLEELFGYLIYYAAQLFKAVTKHEPVFEAKIEYIHQYMYKVCSAINNINYVKEQVEIIAQKLNITGIIERLGDIKSTQKDDHDGEIEHIRNDMQKQVVHVIEQMMKSIVKTMLPKLKKTLLDVSVEVPARGSAVRGSRYSANHFKHVIDFVDNCLITLNTNLERQNFRQVHGEFWLETVDGVHHQINVGLESGKPPDYFQRFNDLLYHLFNLFWPGEKEVEQRMENPFLFEKYEELSMKLSDLELTVTELKMKYFEKRHRRQLMTSVQCQKHGLITIRAGMMADSSSILVELLNARNLKAYDSNNSSDPYAVLTVMPKENFPDVPAFTSKQHKETLFPLFEETFTIPLTNADLSKKGFLMISLYDYDFLGRDDFMGEVFLPLADLKRFDSPNELESSPQMHLVLCKPSNEENELLQKFEVRVWDREASRFARSERDRIDN